MRSNKHSNDENVFLSYAMRKKHFITNLSLLFEVKAPSSLPSNVSFFFSPSCKFDPQTEVNLMQREDTRKRRTKKRRRRRRVLLPWTKHKREVIALLLLPFLSAKEMTTMWLRVLDVSSPILRLHDRGKKPFTVLLKIVFRGCFIHAQIFYCSLGNWRK